MANYNTIGDCYDTLKILKTECPFCSESRRSAAKIAQVVRRRSDCRSYERLNF
jgi:hypothetical protein